MIPKDSQRLSDPGSLTGKSNDAPASPMSAGIIELRTRESSPPMALAASTVINGTAQNAAALLAWETLPDANSSAAVGSTRRQSPVPHRAKLR